MKKLTNAFAILAASLMLSTPFMAHAQTDANLDGPFNKQFYMKMADKDGMLSKADVMKSVSDKFDAMQKNGMISVEQMGEMLKSLYRGGSR